MIEMVEWECTLKCNFRCKYCTNGRNDCLPQPIKEADISKIEDFIIDLDKKYPNIEFFIFGGEPFLHPKFKEIISILEKHHPNYVIQTNFSKFKPYHEIKGKVQVSVHREQIRNLDAFVRNLEKYKEFLRHIDVMYTDVSDILLAKRIKKFFDPIGETKIAPVADFALDNRRTFLDALTEFNKYKKLFPDLFEEGQRSYIWEKNVRGLISSKGKPCMYKDRYVLYSPDLEEYNCSHRLKTSVCPFDRCFRM